MSIWQNVTWDVARAGGFTAFGLLTLSVAIGLALTLRWQSPLWPRIINSELHNFLSLLALIFTGVHILAVWIDPFTSLRWNRSVHPLCEPLSSTVDGAWYCCILHRHCHWHQVPGCVLALGTHGGGACICSRCFCMRSSWYMELRQEAIRVPGGELRCMRLAFFWLRLYSGCAL